MFGNIKKNNVRSLNLKLNNDAYYDFMIYKGECYSKNDSSSCNVMSLNVDDIQTDGTWVSSTMWANATNDSVELKNIGFTGVDNGLIWFPKDRVSNKEKIDIL